MILKKCKSCYVEKTLTEYYSHSEMSDGFLNKCKECVKNRVKLHRFFNIDKIRLYDNARGNRQSRDYVMLYRRKFPNKYKAHTVVSNAVRNGQLIKPTICESCNQQKKLYGHHADYLKPLEVNWLCQVCHKQWHAVNGEGLNGN